MLLEHRVLGYAKLHPVISRAGVLAVIDFTGGCLSDYKETTKMKIEIVDKPKSKWPFWVYFCFKEITEWEPAAVSRVYYDLVYGNKSTFKKDIISAQIENQWHSNDKKQRVGMLYKFTNAEDRLMFTMRTTSSLNQ